MVKFKTLQKSRAILENLDSCTSTESIPFKNVQSRTSRRILNQPYPTIFSRNEVVGSYKSMPNQDLNSQSSNLSIQKIYKRVETAKHNKTRTSTTHMESTIFSQKSAVLTPNTPKLNKKVLKQNYFQKSLELQSMNQMKQTLLQTEDKLGLKLILETQKKRIGAKTFR